VTVALPAGARQRHSSRTREVLGPDPSEGEFAVRSLVPDARQPDAGMAAGTRACHFAGSSGLAAEDKGEREILRFCWSSPKGETERHLSASPSSYVRCDMTRPLENDLSARITRTQSGRVSCTRSTGRGARYSVGKGGGR
jgi:hypothetical protein